MGFEDVGTFVLAMIICLAAAYILNLAKKGRDSEKAEKKKLVREIKN